MNTQNSIIRNSRIFAAIVWIASFAAVVNAEEMKTNNPYTVVGHQLRSELTTQSPFGHEKPVNMGPTLFQEVISCRFVSTLEEDKYPDPWGGKAFTARESRTYFPVGLMQVGDWTNPCSGVVDPRAIAVALRISAFDPEGTGNVFVAPSGVSASSYPALQFQNGHDAQRECDVALHAASFRVEPDEATDVVIEIIGYFIPDPNGYGKGEKGEKGDRGEQGLQGLQGERGANGEKGDRGEQGLNGDKGDRGEQGLKGDKGDSGEPGLKGDKGDRGEQGLNGDKGDRGEQGLKGDKGDRGEQGLNGEKGDRGEQGLRGEKGDKGDPGPMGPQGPMGPAGAGISMVSGNATFPPPGNLTINHPSITSKSLIILTYTEVSNGNALGVASQTNGSFVASGSPNKPFRWVALNITVR